MDIYGSVFDAVMTGCRRLGLGHGPVYTLTMITLGLGVSVTLLSIVELLWTLGLLDDPYRIDGDLHSQRYLFAVIYVAFVANTILARRKFSADRGFAEERQLQP